MANFKPRLTAPNTANKNFIKKGKRGNNPCIEINNGSVLPNCVGYSWGRWRELLGKDHKLSRYSAYRDWETDRKSTRLNSSHSAKSRMPSSA